MQNARKIKPERTINCRFCKGSRNVYHGLCDGCGHPAANVEVKPATNKPAKVYRIPVCPACHSTNRTELESHRWMCNKCGGIFEREDMGYVDDRPDINAQKREAMTNGRKRREAAQ